MNFSHEAPHPQEEPVEAQLTDDEVAFIKSEGLGRPYVWVWIREVLGKVLIDCEVKFIAHGLNFGVKNGRRYVMYGDRIKIKEEYWHLLEKVYSREFAPYHITPKVSFRRLLRKVF